MSKLKEKFPFFEILVLVVINVCIVALSLFIGLCYSLASSEENSTMNDNILSIMPLGLASIFLPLFVYIFVCYLSQNKIFLHFWLALKNSLKNKILMCILLFIISPIPLTVIIFSISSKYIYLKDLFLNFPLSMGFPLMLFFIFEPVITKRVDKYCKKHPNSKTWLKKNYDLRMEIQKEL